MFFLWRKPTVVHSAMGNCESTSKQFQKEFPLFMSKRVPYLCVVLHVIRILTINIWFFFSQYLVNFLRALNWHIEEDVFQDDTPWGRKTFVNIIATQDPRKPKKMVLASHYDSKNITDRNGREFIGATDSAVPCAILLDIAIQLNCLFEKAQGEKVPKSKLNNSDFYENQIL